MSVSLRTKNCVFQLFRMEAEQQKSIATQNNMKRNEIGRAKMKESKKKIEHFFDRRKNLPELATVRSPSPLPDQLYCLVSLTCSTAQLISPLSPSS